MKLIHTALIAVALIMVAASAQAQTRAPVNPRFAISQEARDAFAAQPNAARARQQSQQQSSNPLLDQFHGN